MVTLNELEVGHYLPIDMEQLNVSLVSIEPKVWNLTSELEKIEASTLKIG